VSGTEYLAALDQVAGLAAFRAELPDLIGLKRGFPEIDIRKLSGPAKIRSRGGRRIPRPPLYYGESWSLTSALRLYGSPEISGHECPLSKAAVR
jgi:hypothetical protein